MTNNQEIKTPTNLGLIINVICIVVIVFVAAFFIGEFKGGSSTSPTSISFNEAKTFMKNRCRDIDQTYIDGKSTSVDNTKIYIFLTQGSRHPDFYCVTMVTENKLEVLKTDCGKYEKVVLFNKL